VPVACSVHGIPDPFCGRANTRTRRVPASSAAPTRTCTTATDFPMDVVIYHRESFHLQQRRYEAAELSAASVWWTESLRSLIEAMPSDWADDAFRDAAPSNVTPLLKSTLEEG